MTKSIMNAAPSNALTELPSAGALIPQIEQLQAYLNEISDMDISPFGSVKVGAAGAPVFTVLFPGDEDGDETNPSEVTGIIVASHKVNAYWAKPYGEGEAEDTIPDCFSGDGSIGVDKAGECRSCALCPYNQYGSASTGRGKACANKRRLYILMEGSVLPMLLDVPPTGIAAYDKYRLRLSQKGQSPARVMTRITLKKAKNANGIAYSTPAFEAVGVVPLSDVSRAEDYAAAILAASRRAGDRAEAKADQAVRPIEASDGGQAGFTPVTDEELPDFD